VEQYIRVPFPSFLQNNTICVPRKLGWNGRELKGYWRFGVSSCSYIIIPSLLAPLCKHTAYSDDIINSLCIYMTFSLG